MKYYSYFPGCSAESTGVGLGLSVLAVAGPLDMELVELEDWNCCGSTPYGSLDEVESIVVVARNLGMVAMDLLPPVRRLFTRQAMGVNGRQPRLALGLPLAPGE